MAGERGLHPFSGAGRRVLLLHPEHTSRSALARLIEQSGFEARQVADRTEASRLAATDPVFPIVLLSGTVGDRVAHIDADVLELIHELRRVSSHSQIVLLIPVTTDLDSCCQAIEAGASDFIEIDCGIIDERQLQRRLDQALERYERQAAASAELHAEAVLDETGIIAQSRAMAEVITRAARVAQISDAPVLIHGESGTGKQLVAELIHRLDRKRCNRPILTVNCAAITGSLAESALFGHVRGAYTGATQERAGYFRAADGGVILLDEIGELEPALQPKLLRTLQEGLILPVGADVEVPVDVRVVAATNRCLDDLVEEDRFRLDLYQRLNVINIEIPPLRERVEDIEALVPFFVQKYARYYDGEILGVDRRVYEFLSSCALEGNVRELENTVRRILALKTGGDEIVLTDIPEALRRQRQPGGSDCVPTELVGQVSRMIELGRITLPDFIAECERQILSEVVQRAKGPKTDLARRLGLSRRTLYNKRRKYDI